MSCKEITGIDIDIPGLYITEGAWTWTSSAGRPFHSSEFWCNFKHKKYLAM